MKRCNRNLVSRLGSRAFGSIVIAGCLLTTAGCWGDRSERAVKVACDALPTWHAKSKETCEAISDKKARDECLAKLNADYAELMKKKVDFATAEEECAETAFKETAKVLSEAFKAIVPLLDENTQKELKELDNVLLNASADSSDGSHYVFSPGSTAMVFFEEGMIQQGQLSGFLDVDLHPEGDGWSGTVLAAEITALTAFGPGTATLNSGAPSTITLQPDPDDPGRLIGGLHLLVDVDNDWLGDPLWWVTLPVVAFDPTTELLITTEGMGVPGTQILPTVESTADPNADCNGNAVPDGTELADGSAADCNSNGRPDECDIADNYATDCNGNQIPDACEQAWGTQCDSNANGILEPDCEWVDCNGNSVLDCDELVVLDLDSDGIIDECEIDCNGNGEHDLHDIVDGVSADCNGNGMPDECEAASVVVEEFFNPGSEPFGWWFLGDADHDGDDGLGAARLVHSNVEFVAGVAALNDTGYTTDAFEVEFDFQMSNPTGGVPDGSGFPDPDGFAFIVSGEPILAPGYNGYGLGYKGLPLASFAVEFDTFQNFVSGQPDDPDSNHVGLDVGGSVESIATAPVSPDFVETGLWHARCWVDPTDGDPAQGLQVSIWVTPPGGSEIEALSADIPEANVPPVKYFAFGAGTGINSADTDVDNVVITLLDADLDGDGVLDECQQPAACEGDANGDGTRDPLDVGYIQARFGCPVGTGDAECDAADQNADGFADPLDVGFVQARFGECEEDEDDEAEWEGMITCPGEPYDSMACIICLDPKDVPECSCDDGIFGAYCYCPDSGDEDSGKGTSCTTSCENGTSITCTAGEDEVVQCICSNYGQGNAECVRTPDPH